MAFAVGLVSEVRLGKELGATLVTEALPYDLWESTITYAQAAQLAGVDIQVIYNWASRGYRGLDGQWQHLAVYATAEGKRLQPIQVLRAEAATRKRARRAVLTYPPNA